MYKYCLKCLSPIQQDGTCKKCGFDNYMYNRGSHHLKPETILHNRYYVGAVLGEGGFGITYVGLDTVLGRKVAIKEFFPSGSVWRDADDSTIKCNTTEINRQNYEIGRQKCISEAQSLAKLDDISAVVRILDFFPENNTAYIIMEYVEGVTLKDYVKTLSEKLTLKQILDFLTPIAVALEMVHHRGFVHRDISPDNIMMTKDGKCKLLDFGAVKAVTPGGAATEHPVIKHGFSPLEMYSSSGLMGPWTDIYSFAATIVYLMTGICPDDPPDRTEMGQDHLPEKLNGKMTPRQRDVLLKAMSIQSKQRYQSISIFMSELRKTLSEPAVNNSGNSFNPNIANNNGVNPNSFNPNPVGNSGFNPNAAKNNGVNPNSFNPNPVGNSGFNPNAANNNGVNPNSFNPNPIGNSGFNPNAANNNGFNQNGFNQNIQPMIVPKKKKTGKIIVITIIVFAVIIGIIAVALSDSDSSSGGSSSGSSTSENASSEYENTAKEFMNAYLDEDTAKMADMTSDLSEDWFYDNLSEYEYDMSFSEGLQLGYDTYVEYATEYYCNELDSTEYELSYEILEIKDVTKSRIEEVAEYYSVDEEVLSGMKLATVEVTATAASNEATIEYTMMLLEGTSGDWQICGFVPSDY